MHIFIDEAGIFLYLKDDPTKHYVSMVGGLIIPDEAYEPICKMLNHLKKQWGIIGEIKGNDLIEQEVNLLAELLDKYDVLFISVIIDAKFLDKVIIGQSKASLIQTILSNISPHHHPSTVNLLKEHGKGVEKMAEQLYVQWYALRALIIRVHQLSTLYYAQRCPKELGSFRWVIDAKDKKGLTKDEKWFNDTLKFFIQGIGQRSPLKMLQDADYSYYKKFDSEDGNGTDINKLLKDLSFSDSSKNSGLQLVDILTTCLRKALNGKFKVEGWLNIGKLMTRLDDDTVLSIALDPKIDIITAAPYYSIIQKLNIKSKKLIITKTSEF